MFRKYVSGFKVISARDDGDNFTHRYEGKININANDNEPYYKQAQEMRKNKQHEDYFSSIERSIENLMKISGASRLETKIKIPKKRWNVERRKMEWATT